MLAECERNASFILPCALRLCGPAVLFSLRPCGSAALPLSFIVIQAGQDPDPRAAGKRKGPRRALALCVVLEAVSQLSDTFGLGGVERLEQFSCRVGIFARLNNFFQRGDNGLDFANTEINADLDFKRVCV